MFTLKCSSMLGATCPYMVKPWATMLRGHRSISHGTLQGVLNQVASGKMQVSEGVAAVQSLGFTELDSFAKPDIDRQGRTGFPEVVYGEGKTVEHVRRIFLSLSENQRLTSNPLPVIATRVSRDVFDSLSKEIPEVVYYETARILALNCGGVQGKTNIDSKCGTELLAAKKHVLVITAGTLDLNVSEEAAVTLELFGFAVRRLSDVGVAGLHRLLAKAHLLQEASAIIVVAGMDCALPSVVAGLVDTPVVAVPTSIGYGASFEGVGALLSALNSCSGGVGVVNIDNGFGAAILVGKMMKQLIATPSVASSERP